VCHTERHYYYYDALKLKVSYISYSHLISSWGKSVTCQLLLERIYSLISEPGMGKCMEDDLCRTLVVPLHHLVDQLYGSDIVRCPWMLFQSV
jgi:hypothetical protein